MPRGKINSARSISKKLSDCRVFLDNAQGDAVVGTMLAAFGYNKTKLKEGQKLLVEAETTQSEFDDKHGKKLTTTKKLDKKWDAADGIFAITRQVADILFGKDPGERKALALNGSRGESLSLWLTQAKSLYPNILKSKRRLAKMSEHNFTKAKLKAEFNLVKEIEKLDSLQENIKGAAQTFTKFRNKKMKALESWMGQAKKFARLALSDKPQLLEKLGITVES